MFAFPSPIWFALIWMFTIFCMFLSAYPPMMATFVVVDEGVHMAPQRLCWVSQIWWGYGCTTPPCFHWYTTVVTRRHRNSSKWWHTILLRNSFLGRGRTFSYNPSSFIFFASTRGPSSNQSSFPTRKVLIFDPIGANLLWPLWSLLYHLHLYICLASYNQIIGKFCLGDAPGF
jgi:hypothetical protein